MKEIVKNYNLDLVIKPEHAGKWIALNPEQTKVIEYSQSFKALKEKLGGNKNVLLMKIQQPGTSYAY
jgi:hypothetical protein